MTAVEDNLSNQLLIALPAMADPNFARTVALICQHDEQGAMGVVVNRASEYTLGQVLSHMVIGSDDQALCARPVLHGGPVHQERGFVLHDGEREWESSLRVGQHLYLTTSRDILEAMARGDGPRNALFTLGCAGWGAGQLEQELAEDSWLTVPADPEVLIDAPLDERWQLAASRIGVDLFRLAGYSGHV